MDIEKPIRTELLEALRDHFDCFEEVMLQHALLPSERVKADVIAFPKNRLLHGHGFAFEIKSPEKQLDHAKWSQAIKQASDYVYAKVISDTRLKNFIGRRISHSFIFPAPRYVVSQSQVPSSEITSVDDILMAAGALHLALNFRVGHARWEKSYPDRQFVLAFGPNEVWNSKEGFVPRGHGLLLGKRCLGARKVDILLELERIGYFGDRAME